MKQQALVIGLGQFGMAVARALTERSVEVLAVDSRPDLVRMASSFVTEAACFDATDESALARTSPERRDVCLCAMGDESREASIICAALLTQMGAPRVIARANDELHARILTLVGATQVVNPERAFGERYASHILHEGIRGELLLGEGVLITEVTPPDAFVGKSFSELELPRRFGVSVVAIRRESTGSVSLPEAHTTVDRDDVLVLVGREGAVSRMMEEV